MKSNAPGNRGNADERTMPPGWWIVPCALGGAVQLALIVLWLSGRL